MEGKKPQSIKFLDFESTIQDLTDLGIQESIDTIINVKNVFVFVHGNHGDVSHMKNILNMYKKLFPSDSIFLNSSCNSKDTHIGGTRWKKSCKRNY